jgi:hypothetical protein
MSHNDEIEKLVTKTTQSHPHKQTSTQQNKSAKGKHTQTRNKQQYKSQSDKLTKHSQKRERESRQASKGAMNRTSKLASKRASQQ